MQTSLLKMNKDAVQRERRNECSRKRQYGPEKENKTANLTKWLSSRRLHKTLNLQTKRNYFGRIVYIESGRISRKIIASEISYMLVVIKERRKKENEVEGSVGRDREWRWEAQNLKRKERAGYSELSMRKLS